METPHAGTRINFEELAARLASRAHELLPQWFPAGKFRGHEFVVGNLAGDPGESLSVNVDTGKWCDFATGEKGGDLISLYAAQHRVSQIEAARALAGDPVTAATTTAKPKPVENWTAILPVPDSAPAPPNTYRQQIDGQWRALTFVARWAYHDTQGRLLGYTVRFTDGKAKQIVPQTFCRNVAGRAEWKWKSFPVPRPLYGLARLAERPEAPVLVVEGEKSADAAHTLLGDRYVVVTWPGGCKALTFADWRYLYGRTVHLWPDADAEGVEAMRRLGGLLHPHCRDLKIIDTSGQPSGWDLADAQAEGWDWPRIRDWGRARAKPYEPADVVDLNEHRRRRPPAAVLDTAERPRFVSQHQLWDEFGLDLNGNGMPLANLNNALKLFEQHAELSDLVHFDEFHQKYFHRDGREWHDVDELNLAAWMQRAIGISRMPDDLVHKAAVIVARRRTRNEPRDWFDSLAWDGTPRIDAFFSDALGADDTDYTRAASRNFWVAIAARIYRPGCRMRNVPVLEGPQERGKSSALALIGGPWYTEASESVMSKDFLQVIQGKLIVEIAELEAFSRAEVARIKQVISNPVDRFRPPYARAPGDFRRQCVFVATTNLHEYLRDTTGGTRFWPIQISDIRLDLIADTRTQLFAEAVHAFKHGATWWEMPAEATAQEQEARREADTWEEIIEEWLATNFFTEVTVNQVLKGALGIDAAKHDRANQLRVAAALRMLGWERSKNPRREGGKGKLVRVWTKPDRLV